MIKAAIYMLYMFSACTAGSFTTVIGDTSKFGAKVIIDNGDTTGKKWFDSLCEKYEYLSYIEKNESWSNSYYDFRIKIVKKATVPGNLILSIDYNNFKDTLSCDSLVFQEFIIDTIKSDTALYIWNYPRLCKRTSLYTISPLIAQYIPDNNHLKLEIKGGIIKDSLIISRQDVEISNVKYGIDGIRYTNPQFFSSCNQVHFFDLRGVKLIKLRKQSIAVVVDKDISKTQLMFVR